MRKLLLAGLILAALVAAISWMMLESAPTSPTDDPITEAPVEPEPTLAVGIDELTPDVGPEVARRTASTDDRANSEPATQEWITIHVLQFSDRTPVPDAEVFVLWQEGGQLLPIYSRLMRNDLEQEFRTHGIPLRSGADGSARLERAGSMLAGIARAGARFGRGSWWQREGVEPVMEILIGEERGFEARVVDVTGTAVADVPLALFQTHMQVPDERKLTDRDGRARFLQLQTRFQHEGEVPTLALGFYFPLLDAPRVPIRWQEPPQEPVELVLPPTGSLAVTVLGTDGSPVSRVLVHVQLHVEVHDADNDEPRFHPRQGLGLTQVQTDEQGVAHFPFVGVGARLDVASRFQNAPLLWTVTTVEGPTRAGEEVVATLRAETEPTVLVFRLVRPDGRPTEGHPYQGVLVWLDAKGKALEAEHLGSNSMDETRRVALPAAEPAGWVRREYHLRRQQQPGEITLTALLDLSAPLLPGEHDLGDVLLAEPPLVAGGIVVDEEGAPVGDAQVAAAIADPGGTTPHPWIPEIHSFETGADGRFRVVGSGAAVAGRLVVRHPLYREANVPLVLGAGDHRIVLERGCIVRGRLIVGEGLQPQEFSMRLATSEAAQSGRQPARVGRDGAFELGGLAAGAARLMVLHRSATVYEVADLMIAPDAPEDPRLNPLDLTGRLHAMRVSVRDASGSPLQHFRVRGLDPTAIEQDWRDGWNGELQLISSVKPARLGVKSEGYLGRVAEGVESEVEVRLDSATATEIQLEDPAIVRNYPGARALLRWESPLASGPNDLFSVRFDDEGKAELLLPGTGDFRVCLTVPVQGGNGRLLVGGTDLLAWPVLRNPVGATPARWTLPSSLAEVEHALTQVPKED